MPTGRDAHTLYQVKFTRSICEGARFQEGLEGDPESLFAECGARFGVDAVDFSLDDAVDAEAKRIRGELPRWARSPSVRARRRPSAPNRFVT